MGEWSLKKLTPYQNFGFPKGSSFSDFGVNWEILCLVYDTLVCLENSFGWWEVWKGVKEKLPFHFWNFLKEKKPAVFNGRDLSIWSLKDSPCTRWMELLFYPSYLFSTLLPSLPSLRVWVPVRLCIWVSCYDSLVYRVW